MTTAPDELICGIYRPRGTNPKPFYLDCRVCQAVIRNTKPAQRSHGRKHVREGELIELSWGFATHPNLQGTP